MQAITILNSYLQKFNMFDAKYMYLHVEALFLKETSFEIL